MKSIYLTITFLLLSMMAFSQEVNFTKYSYTEFFDKINTSKDSVVSLSNIILEFDDVKDKKLEHFKAVTPEIKSYPSKDTLYVTKELILNNVFDLQNYAKRDFRLIMLQNVVFKEKLTLNNSTFLFPVNSVFRKDISIRYQDEFIETVKSIPSIANRFFYLYFL